MDPNVFITIVFAGIAVLAAISGVVVARRMARPAGKKRGGGPDEGSGAAVD